MQAIIFRCEARVTIQSRPSNNLEVRRTNDNPELTKRRYDRLKHEQQVKVN